MTRRLAASWPSTARLRSPASHVSQSPLSPGRHDRPLRLLFTGSSPSDVPTLDVAKEWTGIEKVVAPLVKDRRLETPQPIPGGATLSALLAALRRTVDIWHFAGHGTDSGLVFVNDRGKSQLVNAEMLGQMLAGEGVRLAVLNACRAGVGGGQAASVAGALLRAGIPAVVAMQTNVSDVTADAFAGAFYDAIAVGRGVDRAMTAGRKAIWAAGASEWWTPALFMRTPEGRIWWEPVKTAETDGRARELAYLDGLIEKYRYWAEKYTPLAGIAEVRAAAAEGPRLDLPMLFMPTGFEKLEEHGFGIGRRTERVPVDDLRKAVADYRRLVILGEPGAGKTTTLWRLAYDLAIAAKDDPRAPLPLLAPLGAYTGSEPPLDYAQGFFDELGPYLPAYLNSKRVILLLDALNEMPQQDYKKRIEHIQNLLNQYRDTPVVITCRKMDYVETLWLEKLEIKPLEPWRQREYLQRYLGQAEGEKLFWQMVGDPKVADLWRIWQRVGGTWMQFWTATGIPDDVRIKGMDASHWLQLRKKDLPPLLVLGRNPYMLVMTAQVYATREGVLPHNRGQLLAAFVDALLTREEKRCDPRIWLGADILSKSMARIAYAMQQAGDLGTAVNAQWAAKQLVQRDVDASLVIHQCASATLLDTSDSEVRFVHQLVQEYFTALALVGQLRDGDDLQSLWQDQLRTHNWDEAVILLAGILPDMTPLIERLLVVNPSLAARCIAQSGGKRPAAPMILTLQQRLVNLMQDTRGSIEQIIEAGTVINYLGDPRPGVGLRPNGLPDIDWVLVPKKDPKTGRTEFIYGNGLRRTEPDFWLARNPITRLQFQAFLSATDGFRNPQWWQGLAVAQRDLIGWGNRPLEVPNRPIDAVSWYEAIAFCRWLTAKAQQHSSLLPRALCDKQGWHITLPTEWQWEKAARGHKGRYPWSAYHSEQGFANVDANLYTGDFYLSNLITAVGAHPQSGSPYGIHDLGSNVWEWCLNECSTPEHIKENGNEKRVVRGSPGHDSNYYESSLLVAAVRLWTAPNTRRHGIGFRVVIVS